MEERLAQFQTGSFEGGTNVTSVVPLNLADDRFKPLLTCLTSAMSEGGRTIGKVPTRSIDTRKM